MIGNGNTGQAASNASHAVLYGACGAAEIKKPKRGPVGKTCGSACRKKLHRRMRAESIELEAPNDGGTGFTLPGRFGLLDEPDLCICVGRSNQVCRRYIFHPG